MGAYRTSLIWLLRASAVASMLIGIVQASKISNLGPQFHDDDLLWRAGSLLVTSAALSVLLAGAAEILLLLRKRASVHQ
jgi:hypothetical protein